jgi:NADH-quinone oxidoreductase subunit H
MSELSMGWMLLATVLKIAFILGVTLLVFAPVFVLFERRQSAMAQDRVGPMMGGIKMPKLVLDAIPLLRLGALAVAGLSFAASALALGALPFSHWAFLAVVAAGGLAVVFGGAQRDGRLLRVGAVITVIGALADVGHLLVDFESVEFVRHAGLILLVSVPLGAVHVVLGLILPHLFHHDRLTLFGGLHALFDAVKSFAKEDFVPPNGDKLLFGLGPIVAMIPAFAIGAVIPFGPTLYVDHLLEQLPPGSPVDGPAIALQVASLDVGILYIFAVAGTGIIGAAISGYSSDNKYALLGGLRAASQMVSYEVTLGLALVPMFMIYDTLLLGDMVQWQIDHVWGVVVQPLAFLLFQTAAIAEYKRVPFDAPEGESEIVAGYFLEYSSGKWLMYMIGEFLEVGASSMLIALLFFGGWDVPFMTHGGWEAWGWRFDLTGTNWAILSDVANSHLFIVVLGITAFIVKALILGIVSIQIRWTLPRFRYDQIMQLCWKLVLPLALVNIFVTGVFIMIPLGDWVPVVEGLLMLGFGLLVLSFVGRRILKSVAPASSPPTHLPSH